MEGSKVEIYPSSLTLPVGPEESQFVLVSVPCETGLVNVLGKLTKGGLEWIISLFPVPFHSCFRSSNFTEGWGLFFFSLAGYEGTVFGVHHKCNMKISGNPFIRVIPQFPLLKVRSFPIQTAAASEKGEGQGVGGRRVSKAGIEKFDLMDGERCVKLNSLIKIPYN